VTSTAIGWITPDWPAPEHVHAISTLRAGGVSEGPYGSLNLAGHVGDRPESVTANRLLLRTAARLPAEPLWLEQVHGVDVARHPAAVVPPKADAAVAFQPGQVCAVLTADCLPVVFTDRGGTRIGVSHAGWRGLQAGVLEATIAALGGAPEQLQAWLGPAIGPDAFEVGGEVREAFLRRNAASEALFQLNDRGRYQADLCGLARLLLGSAGVHAVHGGEWCTYREPDRFFSFRRDGVTGRMATLAWLA